MNNLNPNKPRIIPTEAGSTAKRGSERCRMANSSVHWIGGFFDPSTGTGGAQTYAANQNVRAICVDILTYTQGGYVSVSRIDNTPGVITLPTTTNPLKYTASATNTSRTYPDLLLYEVIAPNDKVIAFYTNSSEVLTSRGTTAASAVINNFVEPNVDAPWTLLESSANSSITGLNLQISGLPANPLQIEVKLALPTGANG